MSSFLRNTTSAAVDKALLAKRRKGNTANGTVLTLLIAVDGEAHGGDEHAGAVDAATRTAAEHPSRILVVHHRPDSTPSRLDAEVFGAGERGPGELVVLDLHGEVAAAPASVVLPLLVPDTPVVTYWPGDAPRDPARTALGALSLRRITDAAATPDATAQLRDLAAHYTPGDTDLAWTRLTAWRSVLAAALDQDPTVVAGGTVEGEEGSPSARLLAGWLSAKLAVAVDVAPSAGPGLTEVRLDTAAGNISVRRHDGVLAMLAAPGWPERPVALKRRPLTELIAEELRRLDPDEIYAESLAAACAAVPSGVSNSALQNSGAAP